VWIFHIFPRYLFGCSPPFGGTKKTGSSQEPVQNFVVKVPQIILNQLSLKAFNEISRVDQLLSFLGYLIRHPGRRSGTGMTGVEIPNNLVHTSKYGLSTIRHYPFLFGDRNDGPGNPG
jgi:hypothetical protein